VGEDAHGEAVLDDGKAADLVLAHEVEGFLQALVGVDGHRVGDEDRLGLLHLPHLLGLLGDGQVLVDDAEAALARHGDGGPELGHGVHGGAQERDVDRDGLGQPCPRGRLGREDLAEGRHEKDVVERQALP
jgi:hypothetical protein